MIKKCLSAVIGSLLLFCAGVYAQDDKPGYPPVGVQPDPSVVVEAKTEGDRARVAVAFLKTAFNEKKIAEAFALYAGPTYKQHSTRAPDGAEILIKLVTEHLKKQDINYYVKRTLVDGDLVVVHSYQTQSSISNPEDLRGYAVIDIFGFDKGKIVEHWSVQEPVPEKSANPNGMF